MKLIAFALLLFVITPKWETDFEHAKKIAKDKNELILLNFSGSDWCGPCIVLHKDYIGSDAFQKMADKNLVLVNADFPRKKANQLSAEQTKKNEALAEKYNKEGMFPLTLLLSADGKIIKQWKGKPQASAEKWTAEIQSLCSSKK